MNGERPSYSGIVGKFHLCQVRSFIWGSYDAAIIICFLLNQQIIIIRVWFILLSLLSNLLIGYVVWANTKYRLIYIILIFRLFLYSKITRILHCYELIKLLFVTLLDFSEINESYWNTLLFNVKIICMANKMYKVQRDFVK